MNHKIIGLLVFLIGLGILFIIFVFSVLFFLFNFGGEHENITSDDSTGFLFSDYNPSLNQTTYGFSNFNKKLSKTEFLSYFNPNTASTIVISNFFDDEYECTGTCYCDEEIKRRNSVSLLNRGLFLIISALSVTMASNIAREAFMNECQEVYSGMCSKINIKSEIDQCNELDNLIKDQEEELLDETEMEEFQKRTYICHGHCVENIKGYFRDTSNIDDVRGSKNVVSVRKSFGDCTALQLSQDIEIIVRFVKSEIRISNNRAKVDFAKNYLTNFCVSQSLVKFNRVLNSNYYSSVSGEDIVYKYFEPVETPACTARGQGTTSYTNIKCKLVKKEFL